MKLDRVSWVVLLAVVASLLETAIGYASPVLTFNEATGANGVNQNQSVGWQFNVLEPLTVSGLGWFDEGANGLATSHTVGIWNPSGTLLASALVPGGTIASLDGQFRTMPVSPFTLPVGTGYIVGGQNFSSPSERLTANVTQTLDARVSYVDATFSTINSGFVRPTSFSVANTGFYGPSFSVLPVPEASGATMASVAAAAVLWFARTRRATAR